MKLNKSYFFLLLFIFSFGNSVAMKKTLGKEVPEGDLKLLKPWNEKKVNKGSLVAYKSGQRFYYASLYQKENDGDYTIIIKKSVEKNVESTHGKIVTSDYLRIIKKDKSGEFKQAFFYLLIDKMLNMG